MSKQKFSIGDTVHSFVHGTGKVTVSSDYNVTVKFEIDITHYYNSDGSSKNGGCDYITLVEHKDPVTVNNVKLTGRPDRGEITEDDVCNLKISLGVCNDVNEFIKEIQ